MPESELSQLRELRERVNSLGGQIVDDYKPFFIDKTALFYRLPSEAVSAGGKTSVTTTATALMALGMTKGLAAVLCPDSPSELPKRIAGQLQKVLAANWTSASLPQNNAFSTSIVLRAIGLLVELKIIRTEDASKLVRACDDRELNRDGSLGDSVSDGWRTFNAKSIAEIATIVLSNAPKSLSVMKYGPNPAIGYWFVSGCIKLHLDPAPNKWEGIVNWLTAEFYRQVSLVSADHPSLMDPIALAMATAACKKVSGYVPGVKRMARNFPTEAEFRYAIRLFMSRQNKAGTWEKYFPMFHYPDFGSNHCWHFEVLEALLREFPEIVANSTLLEALERTTQWLESNRLTWAEGGISYSGWNSGGQQQTLANGEPESWATGVVHMFLRTTSTQLSDVIRTLILVSMRSTRGSKPDPQPWQDLIDSKPTVKASGDRNSLKDCVHDFMIDKVVTAEQQDGPIAVLPKEVKRSALLFGPPGTGKTRFVRAVAKAIGWDFVEITPTSFLDDGLDGIYAQANRIFTDLRDVSRAVIFFDELDAMLQRRVDDKGNSKLDVHQQFLTTCMLPHLAELYDSRRVLFFFATNHKKTFDEAITRAGRFDMLLFVGPPNWKTKTESIMEFATLAKPKKANETGKQLLKWIPEGDGLAEPLTRATFAETKGMFREVCQGEALDTLIENSRLDEKKLREVVTKWSTSEFSLYKTGSLKEQYDEEFQLSEIRW